MEHFEPKISNFRYVLKMDHYGRDILKIVQLAQKLFSLNLLGFSVYSLSYSRPFWAGSASIKEEMQLHMQKRHMSVIKFYNFIRSNRSAPLKVKLNILRSCVTGSILHHCEAFGDQIPKDLEASYMKMLKSCFNVRVRGLVPQIIWCW